MEAFFLLFFWSRGKCGFTLNSSLTPSPASTQTMGLPRLVVIPSWWPPHSPLCLPKPAPSGYIRSHTHCSLLSGFCTDLLCSSLCFSDPICFLLIRDLCVDSTLSLKKIQTNKNMYSILYIFVICSVRSYLGGMPTVILYHKTAILKV